MTRQLGFSPMRLFVELVTAIASDILKWKQYLKVIRRDRRRIIDILTRSDVTGGRFIYIHTCSDMLLKYLSSRYLYFIHVYMYKVRRNIFVKISHWHGPIIQTSWYFPIDERQAYKSNLWSRRSLVKLMSAFGFINHTFRDVGSFECALFVLLCPASLPDEKKGYVWIKRVKRTRGPSNIRVPGTYNNHCSTRAFLLCPSLSFSAASGGLESSRGHFPPVPTVSRDPAGSFFPVVVLRGTSSPLVLYLILLLVLFAARGSLSFHYYCPILPLTSFFMPPRRSLWCHSNLRGLRRPR